MKVKELIFQLQMIENQEAEVVVDNMYVNFITYDANTDEYDDKVYQYVWLYD